MLDINYEFRKGILFIRLCGDLNTDTSHQLRKEISDMIRESGITNVVFNISELNSIDEVGIKDLYDNLEFCKRNQGRVLFCKPNKKIETFLLNYLSGSFFIDDELTAFKEIIV